MYARMSWVFRDYTVNLSDWSGDVVCIHYDQHDYMLF